MSGGRLLQSYQPLKTHEMLTVDIRVRQITSCEDDDDRWWRWLESATRWM